MKSYRNGFTLIELMVVVIIIAALAGMVLPHLLPASDKAKANIASGDIANISLALKMSRLHVGRYPSTSEGLDSLRKPAKEYNGEPFLEKDAVDPWHRKYQYQYPGAQNAGGFDLWSQGPDSQKTDDDITNWKTAAQ